MIRRLLIAIAFLLSVTTVALAQDSKKASLTILHVNDVYEISPKRGKGGMAPLMTLLKAERARAKNSIFTFGGDLISPSVMSGLTKGAQMIEMMNALGVDYAGLGNHEFDFGDDILLARMKASKFAWLATNTLGADGKPFGGAKALILRKVDDLQIGFFSLLTPETDVLSAPSKSVKFLPVLAAAKQAVKDLRAQGADFVIGITHLDLTVDRAIAAQVRGLDVIMGGHDHDPISIYEGSTLIVKAGYDAHYLAVVDLEIELKQTKRGPRLSVLPQWRFISTAGVAEDKDVGALVAKYDAKLNKELDVPVGKTTVLLDSQRATVRTRENALSNLIADAIRAGVNAEVGLTNGGGIRGDRTYDAGTTLTRKDVLTELPFGNVVVLLELNGKDLLAALENGVSRIEDKAGRFTHVSGMQVVYDPSAPKGARIVSATIGGQPIHSAQTYKVATNDYIAGGGDGFASLKNGKALIDAAGATLMATIVMDYITKQGSIAPKIDGRFKTK